MGRLEYRLLLEHRLSLLVRRWHLSPARSICLCECEGPSVCLGKVYGVHWGSVFAVGESVGS